MQEILLSCKINMEDNFQVRDLRNGDWYYVHKIVYEKYGQRIGAIGLAIYNALCYYANTFSGKCYPSENTLSQKLNISSVCIRFYLKKLQAQKLIKIISGKKSGKVNLYYILKVKNKVKGSKQVTTPRKQVIRGSKQVTTNKNKITRIINNKEVSIEDFYGKTINAK